MPRAMELHTPLGGDALLLHSLSASEELGRLFEYDIGALSARGDLDPDALLGKHVTVLLELPGGEPRCFDGCVARFGLTGTLGRYHHYRITARPWLWLLTRASDCRIFQDRTVPQIVQAIFEKYPAAQVDNRLANTYRTWEYCVQYRETDFNFVSRLMEQEGIYYYFTHRPGAHTLVLADAGGAHARRAGCESLPFALAEQASRPERERVDGWRFTREIQPGAYALDDFDFQKPGVELQVSTRQPRGHDEARHELYDYPGEYGSADDGDQCVRTRLEALQARHDVAQGTTNARGLCVGALFELTQQPRADQNKEYLVVAANSRLTSSAHEAAAGDGEAASYGCGFSAIDARVPFRAQRLTPKPVVQGPQTAIVVGPAGEEIHTDRFGRVKVQFHWDRYGKRDAQSSCWMRVSHPWAGKGWGAVSLPRVGQEVIVDFLEGDPDRPIITGRVYNAEQMPPYELPANKTQSGIKTRSSAGGSPANFNEIRFEDKKGAEQLSIHAEKDQAISVENDESHSVGHDRTKTIDHDETTHVKHDRTETVDNNETIKIGVDRKESVGANETIDVGANRTESVKANETIDIGADRNISVHGSETAFVALQRTHAVGVNETITIGAAQEVGIGAFQMIGVGAYQAVVVGAYQTVKVGASQKVEVGASQDISVGANRSVRVTGNESVGIDGNAAAKVGGDEARKVVGGRSTSVGKDDALKVANNFGVDAGDSITLKTGSASITLSSDGTITIKGKNIAVKGSGGINVKASDEVVIKGSQVLDN